MTPEETGELAAQLSHVAHNHVQNGFMRHDVGIALWRVVEPYLAEMEAARQERDRLKSLLDDPEVFNFLVGVQNEAAHQKHTWGEITDREKSAEQWFWRVGYLASRALRAHIEGDILKALHHTISAAAALANWHGFIFQDKSGVGLTSDPDMRRIVGEVKMPSYEDIQNINKVEKAEDIRSVDLRREAEQRRGWSCWRASLGNTSAIEILYYPEIQRAGIAWGADAQWTDASSIQDALKRFLGVDGAMMSE